MPVRYLLTLDLRSSRSYSVGKHAQGSSFHISAVCEELALGRNAGMILWQK